MNSGHRGLARGEVRRLGPVVSILGMERERERELKKTKRERENPVVGFVVIERKMR